jgi:arsenate reductase (thioredoxin)
MEPVIFACVHNAGRSQIGPTFLSQMADATRVQAASPGTHPGERVHPEVVNVMREVGIDLTDRQPRRLTDELARGASLLITMGCGDECPYIPGLQREDWPLRGPKDLPMSEVRAIRDGIRDRVDALVESRGWRRQEKDK